MGASGHTVRELRLWEQANRQFGLLRHEDLVASGLTRNAVTKRLASHRLTRIQERVYAFGHTALRDEARLLAALWACGPQAVLSHVSAAVFYRWLTADADDPVHVSTMASAHSRTGLTVHRVRRLHAVDVFRPPLFAVTTIPRTFVDLADVLAWPAYRALADVQPQLRVDKIREAQRRAPNRRGAPLVTRLIEADDVHTKSELERRFLRFLSAHRLSRPAALNVRVAGHKADCHYPDERLVVELDGRAFHQRRAQMRADRLRDADYQLSGHRILRLLWDDLHPEEADRTADRVRRMLAAALP